ncbi:MAG: aldo/keto reductase [Desulfuromonadales bacterium]
MHYRPYGKTGLSISAISFGTVSLGVDYGIESPGDFGRPDECAAIRLLEESFDVGINLFDTAPAYGASERLLGIALGAKKDAIFATKITMPTEIQTRIELKKHVEISVLSSLKTLRRDYIDILQVHNLTVEALTNTDITEILADLKISGITRFVGATVYSETESLAVVKSGGYDSLQLAFSILDQRQSAVALPGAKSAGVGVMARSSLLKGALTPKGRWLPDELEDLRQSVEKVVGLLECNWDDLPEIATRYCLSIPLIDSVLIGARTHEELTAALEAERKGDLGDECISKCANLGLNDENLLNPSKWPLK